MKWGFVKMVVCFSLLACQGSSKRGRYSADHPALKADGYSTSQGSSNQGNVKCGNEITLDVNDTLFTENMNGLWEFGKVLLLRNLKSYKTTLFRNQMISSFSIGTALAMVEEGSHGKTKKEILKTLGLNQRVKETFKSLIEATNEAHLQQSNLTVSLANAVFVKEKSAINDDFIDNMKCNFKGEVANMKKKPDKQINSWISDQTNDTIKNVVKKSDLVDAMVVLVNTIYFKGAWLNPFRSEGTRRFIYYSRKNFGVKMPFISQEEQFKYRDYPDKKIIRIPYKGNRIALYIVLPVEEGAISLMSVLYNLPSRDDSFNPKKMKKKSLKLLMPEFKIEAKLKLSKQLKKLGIVEAFQRGAANLKRISLDNLYISEIFHKTFIEVDKDGSTAGASTAAVATVFRSSPQTRETFVVDRPFIFIIKDDVTGAALFQGVFKKPQKKEKSKKKEET